MSGASIGSIVEVARQGSTRYVVAEIIGGPQGDYVRLVRKRADGGYSAFVRPREGLVEIWSAPFTEGEQVKINGVPEVGTYLGQQIGIARVSVPAWERPLVGVGVLQIDPMEARVSMWSLVLENRLATSPEET